MAVFDPARLKSDKVDERAALRRLARLEKRARLILLFEALWPTFVAALSLCGFVLILIVIGLFEFLPPILRGLAFAATSGAVIALLIRGFLNLNNKREDQLARIDRDTGLPHRPALSLADYSTSHLDDPMTFALWRAYRRDILRQAHHLRLAWPHPHVYERDHYALRFAVLIGLIAAIIITGPEATRRIESALIWTDRDAAIAAARLDGWIDPPAYTGLPPVLLEFNKQENRRIIKAPTGSKLVLRRSDSVIALPSVTGGALAEENTADANQQSFIIKSDATITADQLENGSLKIEAIPDIAPSIVIVGMPQRQTSGGMSLSYHIEDDYGVASGSTRMTNPRLRDIPLIGQHAPLIAAPDQMLSLPSNKRDADGRINFEVSDSPWAGTTIDLTLSVKDDAGQSAETGVITLRLPERVFTMPVAKSLIEERRRLALDPSTLPRVREAVDLILLEPEFFKMAAADYLGIRSIRTQIDEAQDEDALRNVVKLMWDVALAIENGGSSNAERALNAAQDALRDALERGASDEEIRALTDRLKDALDAYLKDYAERALKQMQQSGNELQPEQQGRTIRPEDLKSLLDKMQEMAKNGAREDAARMLDALSSILKNLQASRPRLSDPSQQKGEEALNGLDKMMRDQRGLRDDTFRQGRQSKDAAPELGDRQRNLRSELDKLREAMKGLGEQGERALGEAGEAMGRAEEALKKGDIPGALRDQNKALEGLRAGQQALAEALQGEDGEGQAGSEDSQSGQSGEPRGQLGQSDKRDPLGRENGQYLPEGGELNEKNGGKSAGDRARNVLDELRKRLGEDERSKVERDYYRRLIGPN